jgi:hypothetical protein
MLTIDEMLAPASEAPPGTRIYVFEKLRGEPRFELLPFGDENGEWLDRALSHTMRTAEPNEEADEDTPIDGETFSQRCHARVEELVDVMIGGWACKDPDGEYVAMPKEAAKEFLHKLIDVRPQGLSMFVTFRAAVNRIDRTTREEQIDPTVTAGNSDGG